MVIHRGPHYHVSDSPVISSLLLLALLAFRSGDFQESYSLVSKSLQIFPNHNDSKELKENLEKLFSAT